MKNIELYKELLTKEKTKLEEELRSVGRVNPENPNDWQGTPGNADNVDDADENSLADKFEQFEERSAVEGELEARLNEVKNSLLKIENGEFGICKICGKEIEDDRLDANPAAETCKEHINN
ncbi:MAG: TraR/DksA C4-type zinc finger protein [Candidatus Paceibacterota bacterium]|jgi:RNA polymerase-binding transcription factor DksA|nr:TraR/DksA C4-type zinc finger protein [Candidatus Paceibacterota bacterium]